MNSVMVKTDRTFMEAFIRPGIGLNNWVSRTNLYK